MCPALAGRFLTTGPPEKSYHIDSQSTKVGIVPISQMRKLQVRETKYPQHQSQDPKPGLFGSLCAPRHLLSPLACTGHPVHCPHNCHHHCQPKHSFLFLIFSEDSLFSLILYFIISNIHIFTWLCRVLVAGLGIFIAVCRIFH